LIEYNINIYIFKKVQKEDFLVIFLCASSDCLEIAVELPTSFVFCFENTVETALLLG
jgi:hypothetical protein